MSIGRERSTRYSALRRSPEEPPGVKVSNQSRGRVAKASPEVLVRETRERKPTKFFTPEGPQNKSSLEEEIEDSQQSALFRMPVQDFQEQSNRKQRGRSRRFEASPPEEFTEVAEFHVDDFENLGKRNRKQVERLSPSITVTNRKKIVTDTEAESEEYYEQEPEPVTHTYSTRRRESYRSKYETRESEEDQHEHDYTNTNENKNSTFNEEFEVYAPPRRSTRASSADQYRQEEVEHEDKDVEMYNLRRSTRASGVEESRRPGRPSLNRSHTRVRRNPPRRTFSVTEYEENQLNNGHDKAVAYNDSDSSGNEKLMPSERPSNTAPTDVGVNLHELVLAKKSSEKADIDPIEVDPSVDWNSIGGLDSHVSSLKEMVVLPMLYPDLFTRFSISPPRGVLFYGPPGTGKTLVARALANTCSAYGQKVTFFMRKGADCLSKWVGEAERQLRLLFEQAKAHQPSIIFFDEIDGLAPVRSSRQDQIHSSIVSTLLALMDGIDSRGQIIIIGATNRPDAIDPALRRPGRFDRELYFPLPSKVARKSILEIHTKKWEPSLNCETLEWLVSRTAGYCGADLRALCAEASLKSVRRMYPQIYQTNHKLLIDFSTQTDFEAALNAITPASHRSATSGTYPLPSHLVPLLGKTLQRVIKLQQSIFPLVSKPKSNDLCANVASIEIDSSVNSVKESSRVLTLTNFGQHPLKARLLVCGVRGMGQSHIASSLLQTLEEYPTYSIDLPLIYGDSSAKNGEEVLVRQFTEAKRNSPCVIFWPHVDLWWENASESLRCCLEMLISDIPFDSHILLFATADQNLTTSNVNASGLHRIFDPKMTIISGLDVPGIDLRKDFFTCLYQDIFLAPKVSKVSVPTSSIMNLQVITVDCAYDQMIEQRKVDEIAEADVETLRQLRMTLRSINERLIKVYKEFVDPVDDDVYRQLIVRPICLADIESRINNQEYLCVKDYLKDIDLLVSNCKEYCEGSGFGNRLISKVYQLQDSVLTMVTQIDRNFIKKCDVLAEKKRSYVIFSKSYHIISQLASATLTENQGARVEVSKSCDVGNFDEIEGEADSAEILTTSFDEVPASYEMEQENHNETSESIGNPSSDKIFVEESAILSGPPSPQIAEEVVTEEVTTEDVDTQEKFEFECKVDTNRLSGILNRLLEATDACSVDELEKILFRLYRHYHLHFSEPEKNTLLDALELEISSL